LSDLITVDTGDITSQDEVSQDTSQDSDQGDDQQGTENGGDDDTGDFGISQTSAGTRHEATALVLVGTVFRTKDLLAQVVCDTTFAVAIGTDGEQEQVLSTTIDEGLTVASASTSVGQQRGLVDGVDGGAISVGDVTTARTRIGIEGTDIGVGGVTLRAIGSTFAIAVVFVDGNQGAEDGVTGLVGQNTDASANGCGFEKVVDGTVDSFAEGYDSGVYVGFSGRSLDQQLQRCCWLNID